MVFLVWIAPWFLPSLPPSPSHCTISLFCCLRCLLPSREQSQPHGWGLESLDSLSSQISVTAAIWLGLDPVFSSQWLGLTQHIANYSKSLKKWECLTILSIYWETYMWDRKQQLELDMEQLIGSKLGKKYDKAEYCLPAYLTYMQNTSYERLDWRNPKPEVRLLEEISTTSDMQMIPLWWQKVRRN